MIWLSNKLAWMAMINASVLIPAHKRRCGDREELRELLSRVPPRLFRVVYIKSISASTHEKEEATEGYVRPSLAICHQIRSRAASAYHPLLQGTSTLD